jgi:DNA-binding MarR family transcriptional regulator
VLLTLAGRPGLTATELADLLALDKMAVSRATRRLEQLERVARVVDRTDHRRSHLTLTDKGWELYHRIAPAGQAREALLLQPLNGPERTALDAILDRLLAQARRMSHDEDEADPARCAAAPATIVLPETTIPGATLPTALLPGALSPATVVAGSALPDASLPGAVRPGAVRHRARGPGARGPGARGPGARGSD